MTLQNLNSIEERIFAVAAKADALERVHVVEETAAASLAVWVLEKIDTVRERDEARATVERLNTDLMALFNQVFAHASVKLEFDNARDVSSRFDALWKSALKRAKATERHLLQVAQQLTVAQAKKEHGNRRSRGFEEAFLIARDVVADQSSLVANERPVLDASLQKSTKTFFMGVLDHVRTKGLVFRTRIPEHFGVIQTTVRARQEGSRQGIATRLDCSWSHAEVGEMITLWLMFLWVLALMVEIPVAQARLRLSAVLCIVCSPYSPLLNKFP